MLLGQRQSSLTTFTNGLEAAPAGIARVFRLIREEQEVGACLNAI